jgi:hypothetical protein
MTKPLSPAAQAVLDAIGIPAGSSQFLFARRFSALVLRAVADQVVPEDYCPYTFDSGDHESGLATRNAEIRSQIRSIAAELEGGQ